MQICFFKFLPRNDCDSGSILQGVSHPRLIAFHPLFTVVTWFSFGGIKEDYAGLCSLPKTLERDIFLLSHERCGCLQAGRAPWGWVLRLRRALPFPSGHVVQGDLVVSSRHVHILDTGKEERMEGALTCPFEDISKKAPALLPPTFSW